MAIRLSRTFVLRKLHQLSGIVPLGIFLLEHFYTNSKALTGAADFNNAVKDLQSIPYILFVEIGGIFIPLIYHAVYGLVITMEARPNNLAYPYPRNWFYLIQRITGVILFFFITFHVLNFRFGMIPGLNNISVAHHPEQGFRHCGGRVSHGADFHHLHDWHHRHRLAFRKRHLVVPGRLGNHDRRTRTTIDRLRVHCFWGRAAAGRHQRGGRVHTSRRIVGRNPLNNGK